MKQKGKQMSAYIRGLENEEYDIRTILHYSEFVKNHFNVNFDFIFSRSSPNKHQLAV
jgi:hypothetical protein